ncbi:integrin-linked protein kinase 1-like [Humulus lupulus]|uniref:integrin-linked protein kinase 1-like n=1 Tax=Humulus lupulus TaxID=3486 RepID=UPI002B4047C0|nr:integrin-linked protein kinase 1-like [Humulus lupulus]XP_062107475.1 integrin-linked protein kinase 1-like [Humulus lupulus]
MDELKEGNCSEDYAMQVIGKFLSYASRGDRVGLNLMLIKGIPPNVQDYDNRTALHLAASEGHAPIVELLLHHKANVNLIDRWQRTPLTDARLYGHRDICRILEVNGGKDFFDDQQMTVRQEDLNEVNFDISEIDSEDPSPIDQGKFGESVKVKWRGTWVVKTVIKRQIKCHFLEMVLFNKDSTRLRELRHPNILQFLGSIEEDEQMILITEYLSIGNLEDILKKRFRLDLPTAVRYALDIARGMNYLHQHKPHPIVHNQLDTKNLLIDEGDHLKIGEYWIRMLYEQINPIEDNSQGRDGQNLLNPASSDTKKDVFSFGYIFYRMLEGRNFQEKSHFDLISLEAGDFKPKFLINRYSDRIKELIEWCTRKDPIQRPSFDTIITILEEETMWLKSLGCPVPC